MPKYNTDTAKALGEGEKVKAWKLQLLGTLPELQKEGLATALVQEIATRVRMRYRRLRRVLKVCLGQEGRYQRHCRDRGGVEC